MAENHPLDYYITQISTLFDNNEYSEAHKKAVPYVKEMSANKNILFEVVRRNLSQEGYIGMRYWGPIMAFQVTKDSNFTLDINCFLPGPTPEHTSITTQSIHHHGNLMLTVVGAFGSGYESFIFKPDFKVDKETSQTKMQIEHNFYNALGHVSFIDAYTPHVVFFPEKLNLSYTLFSANKKVNIHALKEVGVLQKHKEPIKRVLRFFGLLNKFNLQDRRTEFDFCPQNGQLISMKERIDYSPGPREAEAQNLFYILQQIGFEDVNFWREREKGLTPTQKELVLKWADMWIRGEEIKCIPDAIDIANHRVNFRKSDILICIDA